MDNQVITQAQALDRAETYSQLPQHSQLEELAKFYNSDVYAMLLIAAQSHEKSLIRRAQNARGGGLDGLIDRCGSLDNAASLMWFNGQVVDLLEDLQTKLKEKQENK